MSLAVAKVEALTRQLEELRRDRRGLTLIAGNGTNQQPQSPAARELEKLRRELMVSQENFSVLCWNIFPKITLCNNTSKNLSCRDRNLTLLPPQKHFEVMYVWRDPNMFYQQWTEKKILFTLKQCLLLIRTREIFEAMCLLILCTAFKVQ